MSLGVACVVFIFGSDFCYTTGRFSILQWRLFIRCVIFCLFIGLWWQNPRVIWLLKNCRRESKKSSTQVLCQCWHSLWKTTLRCWSTAATTKSCLPELKLLTGLLIFSLQDGGCLGLAYFCTLRTLVDVNNKSILLLVLLLRHKKNVGFRSPN